MQEKSQADSSSTAGASAGREGVPSGQLLLPMDARRPTRDSRRTSLETGGESNRSMGSEASAAAAGDPRRGADPFPQAPPLPFAPPIGGSPKQLAQTDRKQIAQTAHWDRQVEWERPTYNFYKSLSRPSLRSEVHRFGPGIAGLGSPPSSRAPNQRKPEKYGF